MNIQKNEPVFEERRCSMMSYMSVIFGGIILSLIIFFRKGKTSAYIKYHSLQATFFHLSFIIVIVLVSLFFVIIYLLFGASPGNPSSGLFYNGSQAARADPPVIFLITYLFLILCYVATGITCGILAFKSRRFRIPLIGKMAMKRSQ